MAETGRVHSEVRQRTAAICVRFLPSERRLLKAVAKLTGKSEGAVLRDAFLASVTPQPAPGGGIDA